jgi:hypothetical protein
MSAHSTVMTSGKAKAKANSSCDLGYIIQNHMKFLMDIFQDELAGYYMSNATKCLNTAVMTLFFFLGQQALKHTQFCDVQTVQKRVKLEGDKSLQNVLDFVCSVRKNTKGKSNTLYYVMITDATLPNMNGTGAQGNFPGHVFVIDKSTGPKYNIYQSYIGEYTLNGAIARNNNSMSIDIQDLIKNLLHMFENGVWDEQVNKFWQRLTFVEEKLLGHIITGHIFFCYQEVRHTTCRKTLIDMLKIKRKTLLGQPDVLAELDTLLAKLTLKD